MATLQNTSINGTLTATTSLSSPQILCQASNGNTLYEYNGYAYIPSSANNATNYVNLFANTGGYSRMYGYISWTVYQSQIHCGAFTFQLSRYGFSTYNHTNTGYWSVSQFQESNPDINHCRFTNTVGTSWGDGSFYFTIQVMGPGSFSSSYITTRNR